MEHKHNFKVFRTSTSQTYRTIYFICDCGDQCQVDRHTYNLLTTGRVSH